MQEHFSVKRAHVHSDEWWIVALNKSSDRLYIFVSGSLLYLFMNSSNSWNKGYPKKKQKIETEKLLSFRLDVFVFAYFLVSFFSPFSSFLFIAFFLFIRFHGSTSYGFLVRSDCSCWCCRLCRLLSNRIRKKKILRKHQPISLVFFFHRVCEFYFYGSHFSIGSWHSSKRIFFSLFFLTRYTQYWNNFDFIFISFLRYSLTSTLMFTFVWCAWRQAFLFIYRVTKSRLQLRRLNGVDWNECAPPFAKRSPNMYISI